MDVQTADKRSVSVLALSGRFDAHEAPKVADWLGRAGGGRAVVNLGGVNFIDSTALATLVQGMKRLREGKGELALCSLQQPVRVIFELTRLDRAFAIYPTEDDAIAALAR